MTSKKYKQLIKEVADELDLPKEAVDDAIKAAYQSLKMEVEEQHTHFKTSDGYDELTPRIAMKYIGSFKPKSKVQIMTMNKKYRDEQKRSNKNK